MSAKSLLQLILLLLIFLIIAGIYYLYFYSGPLKNHLIVDNEKDKTNTKIIEEANNNDQEILDIIKKYENKKNFKNFYKEENRNAYLNEIQANDLNGNVFERFENTLLNKNITKL